MAAEEKSRGWWRRRSYLQDSGWQLSVATIVVGSAVFVVALVHLIAVYVLAHLDAIETLSSRQLTMFAVAFSGLHILLLFIVLVATTVRITHSVAGPAKVIERAIDDLRNGKYDSRLKLRDKDYLKDLAAAVQRLSDHLNQQNEHRAGVEPVEPLPDRARETAGNGQVAR